VGAVPSIFKGQDAARRQFPYQVAMFRNLQGFCGGAVIGDFWILTAAHCVQSVDLFTVFFGAHQMNLPFESGRTVFNTRTSYAHEEFDAKQLHNDIGLVKMPVKIKLSSKVT